MSCVVGLVHEDRVWLGGDSAAISPTDGVTVTYTVPKVFRKGKLLVGCVQSFRMRDLLEHHFTPPRPKKGQSDEAYLVKQVIEEIRQTFMAGGFDPLEELEDDELDTSGAALLGYNGRLFIMEWDYHLGEVTDSFAAIGSGAKFALGSLHITQELTEKFSPRLRVTNALRVAAHFCSGVGPPFRVISGK